MSLSKIGVFVLILLRMLPLVKEILNSKQSFTACSGSLSAVINGYELAVAEKEGIGGEKKFAGLDPHGVALENVTFTYQGTKRPALSDVSLTIPTGKVTAIVGSSGAGKSTLVDIIARLRIPQHGSVVYNNLEGSKYSLSSLRRCIAFVSQDAAIMDDTVAENIRFAKQDASEEEIWEVLDQAQAAEFVKALPNGLTTNLGERGVKLSGGQKQRLSLARALLEKAPVLILDEPTSALDSETEIDIQKAIHQLRTSGDTTIIIIAHRLSTIHFSDMILVLKDGQLIEQGSHKELIISDEWYARVSNMQSADKY
jgi:ABC-type multidrug transport system fused ATPase/permease subunit